MARHSKTGIRHAMFQRKYPISVGICGAIRAGLPDGLPRLHSRAGFMHGHGLPAFPLTALRQFPKPVKRRALCPKLRPVR